MLTITVYSKPSCPQCEFTKRWLTERGVEHTVVDVSANPAALDRVLAMGYSSVPVVVVGSESWSGFRPQRLDELVRVDAA